MTFSIIALDGPGGAAGVASITGAMAVGAFVPRARSGVGAIATQGASTNWLYGERGLALLQQGLSANEVLEQLLASDDGRDFRQCIVCDWRGTTAGWTGQHCAAARTHILDDALAVAGNTVVDESVARAMIDGFRAAVDRPFSERLLAALRAGNRSGGDVRGQVSAALTVDFADRPPLDIRVDFQPDTALDRLVDLHARYHREPFRQFYESVPTRADYSKHRR